VDSIRAHPLLWIFAVVLLALPADAQNLGFEDGLNEWTASYQSNGQNFNSIATNAWSTEGQNSVLFAGANGFNAFGSWKSSINHTSLVVNAGDTVCTDFKKNGTQGGTWTLSSSTLGTIKSPLLNGEYIGVCSPAISQGKIDFTVSGNPQSCGSPCFPTKVFLDNIRHYTCNDDIKNGFETDVDCGGSCARCEDKKACNTNADCSSYYCQNNACDAAPSFMYSNNLNFEQGLNTYWTFGGQQGGAAITSNVSPLWASEGVYGITFSRLNRGIVHGNGFFVNAIHTFNITTGDVVCLDMIKHSETGFWWRVRLGTGGVFLNAPIFNGLYNDTCATSVGSGKLSIVVEGTSQAASCGSELCYGNFSFDNVTINAHLCSNGVLDGYETSVDCGGFCGECSAEEDLLAKYAPVLYFHPDEQFFPTSIEAMLNESDLRHDEIFSNPIVDEMPVGTESLENADEDTYLDMRNASGGFFPLGEVPNPIRFNHYNKEIYGRIVEPDDSHTVLQYWFFYPYNNWKNRHEGDWEMMQIVLDKFSKLPTNTTYSFHYGGATYSWNEIELSNATHPKIYVTVGGHGSWPTTGEHPWVQKIYGVCGTSKDTTASNGTTWYPETYNLIDISSKSWTNFLGTWGELNGEGRTGPNSPPFIKYKDAPNRWSNPIEWAINPSPTAYVVCTGSPVNLNAYDEQGHKVGLDSEGNIIAEIPNTYVYVPSDNEKELLVILDSKPIKFVINATGEGAFNLSITNFDKETNTETTITYQDVRVINETVATLNFAPTNPNFILQIDDEGDGEIDITTIPDEITVQGEPTSQEEDTDNDGLADSVDNCPTLHNPNQNTDFDGDGFDNELCGGDDCNDATAAINPSEVETCDNVDNNCNLQVDENLHLTFGTDIGACEFGMQTCSLGSYGITTPSIEPTNETCNALDDDCDAITDEELNREYGINVGECKKGTETCNNGNWNISIPSKDPSIELCNGKDDDCNGQVDNICARNTKQYAIQLLQETKNGVSCNKRSFCLDKSLLEVIEDIQKSLDLRYYTDNETLKPNKGKDNGENVFEHEIDAVKECFHGKWMRSISPVCEEVANWLTAADKKFAEKALADAKTLLVANPKNQKCYGKEVEKAERFLTKADTVISENFPRMEILNYKKSWEHSQEAVSIAKSTKMEC